MESIVLCIPGPWADRSELVLSIPTMGAGYLMLGNMLMHNTSKRVWTVETQAADSSLAQAFHIAAQGRMNEADVANISSHKLVVYLCAQEASLGSAQATMAAANEFLQAGGFGVKVETSGLAHTPDHWRKLSETAQLFDLYKAYVTLVGGVHFYSYGMKNFGLPDAVVPGHLSHPEATELLNQFCFYLLSEAPTLHSGHTFSLSPDSANYHLRLESDDNYEAGDVFHNPQGRWFLDAI